MEEARREHLKKLQQRRVRFRSKRTPVNDTGENESAISNESIPQCRQSYRPNRFNVQTNEQVIQNTPVNFVPNPKLPPKESDNMHTAPSSGGHIHPFYRHYSLSSYQPAMFLPGYPVPMVIPPPILLHAP
uniref:Uncharacterized protein n=1 Tax=Ciona savignyi TaxID=51511 RepID=H2YIU8_CIOSA